MVESWMVSGVIGIVTIVFGYGVFKNRLENIEDKFSLHSVDDATYHSDIDRKHSAQFRRIDELSERCVRLESSVINHLTITKAEEKFVSKDELALHIKNIDKDISHLTKNSDVMIGKIDEFKNVLSSFMLREMNEKEK